MIAVWVTFVVLMAVVPSAFSQQDKKPIPLPKTLPAKSASATLVVICDLACYWKLDGEAKGHIQAGGSAKAEVKLGIHTVIATTMDGVDTVQKIVEFKSTEQMVADIELSRVRAARLNPEQEAGGKTDRKLQDKSIQEQLDRTEQEERDKATREEEQKQQTAREVAVHQKEMRDHAGARIKEGKELARQQKYTEAKLLFEQSCEGGEMAACRELGEIYEQAKGITQDYSQTVTLYTKACDGGEMEACNNLGLYYQKGIHVKQNLKGAQTLFKLACDRRLPAGCANLGTLYRDGDGVDQDYTQATHLYKKACDGGWAAGCTDLGSLYRDGEGVNQDYGQARELFQKACDLGDMAGCNFLGTLLMETGTEKNDIEARSLFQKACDGGNMTGCNFLGRRLKGTGAEQDYAQALNLFKRACDGQNEVRCINVNILLLEGKNGTRKFESTESGLIQACDSGDMLGCVTLGRLYEGAWKGTVPDYLKAYDLFKRACNAGNLSGCYGQDRLYRKSIDETLDKKYIHGVANDTCSNWLTNSCLWLESIKKLEKIPLPDFTLARDFFQKACDGGDSLGCHDLNSLYELNEGLILDSTRVLQLISKYEEACDGGSMSECNKLGLLYEYGAGVSQNATQALNKFKKACDGEEMVACISLGDLYEGGSIYLGPRYVSDNGVRPDFGKALHLYQKACDGGDMNGCNHFSLPYITGRGAGKDKERAQSIFKISCKNGSETACSNLHRVIIIVEPRDPSNGQ
jgi:TPR repeat protein